jgi:hypothetical protein
MSMKEPAVVIVLVLSLGAVGASVQAPNESPARFAKVTDISCTFSVMATGTWKDGEARSSVEPSKLSVSFHAIDTQEGTAEADSESGKAHITVRLLGSYLHFMQLDPYGALYVTTILNAQTPAGRFQAVQSRHEYTVIQLPGLTSRPEQYYGDCELRP